ncbi:MAG TPA: alpha/beta hydrolase [Pseudonocardiaceae bacterium]|jgi:pimeloyl-ACP methyl ester carboxylesterase|nr:alpha/beta hydrolase [Pseudonocardiaceae bacterium]
MRGHRFGVAMVGAVCATAVVAGSLTAPPASAAMLPEPTLNWQPCASATGFYCADATVPLDYADPFGATIQIAVIKHPATDPTHRIGSLFFNPGGPGGSGVSVLPAAYPRFPATLRADFDLVSFDPRGIGQSTDLKCFPSMAAENQFLAGLPSGFPIGLAQQQAWESRFARFDRVCAANAGPLLAHDSTADVARDLDRLRQAVGDPSMNYLGVSYGSYLGATYANLFPGKVRAITLDGDVDPVQWARGSLGSASWLSTFLRLGSDQGSADTLNAFLTLCGQAAATSCAFSAGGPAATITKFQTLLDKLTAHPVTFDGQLVTMAFAVSVAMTALYDTQPMRGVAAGWTGVATLLQDLWNLSEGVPAPAPVAPSSLRSALELGIAPADDSGYDGMEAQLGVFCSDSPNPRGGAAYLAQSQFAQQRSGWPGVAWTWVAGACAQWPATGVQRYTGPWNVPTEGPVLLIGNTVDPATPYSGALAMSRDLADARLLTVRGYGHTALLNPSSCADSYESAYFLTGALPPEGTVCQQDQPPFPPS